MVDIDTGEVNSFISTMKASRNDLIEALDSIKTCRAVSGWDDENRLAFDAAAASLEKEVQSCIEDIGVTIQNIERIVEKAENIRY